ncbi:hypothetical protein SKAU_G00377860 [Synaphobranchus kaupii]|uniref:RING finger protein 212B n=1 Tax=Synaphobranchus kaupii TaxID=118154 RepID=A0A9Q1ED28_SYNKA|nr:hypothetical protein SKAU_G00377860 [Synaphobranchus kaupii]
MDWLHCNFCFRWEGRNFAVSSCGHISCESCVNSERCNICGAICSYLPISDKMKPQEQVYFRDPLKLLQSRMEHIAQIAVFQRRQKDRTVAFFKHKASELERRLKEIMEQSYRELSDLKRENSELKKPLSQRRISPGQFQSSSSYRLSRPVAITPPVTPRLRICTVSHPEPTERFRDGRSHGPMTPSSAFSLSSLSSLHEPRTPTDHMGHAPQEVKYTQASTTPVTVTLHVEKRHQTGQSQYDQQCCFREGKT